MRQYTKTGLMEKRAYKRIPLKMLAGFFYDNTVYTGRVTNLSKNGMYIETEISLLSQSKLEVLEVHIPFKDEVLKVVVRIKRLAKRGGYFNGMGVELIDPSVL